jgi:hypothetical protein
MTSPTHEIVRLEFCSAFDMLDFVQLVSDHLCRRVGFDEDSMHWVSVAIRESVINAIKHGNRNDASKLVRVEFLTTVDPTPAASRSACATRAKASKPKKSPIRWPRRTCSSRAVAASSSSATSWTT